VFKRILLVRKNNFLLFLLLCDTITRDEWWWIGLDFLLFTWAILFLEQFTDFGFFYQQKLSKTGIKKKLWGPSKLEAQICRTDCTGLGPALIKINVCSTKKYLVLFKYGPLGSRLSRTVLRAAIIYRYLLYISYLSRV
jgi:hypothetical protein